MRITIVLTVDDRERLIDALMGELGVSKDEEARLRGMSDEDLALRYVTPLVTSNADYDSAGLNVNHIGVIA